MIKWILNKLGVFRDEYIFERIIEKDFWLNEKDLIYLKKVGKDKEFMLILDKINASNVYRGMSATTKEGVMRRNEWIKCIGHLKQMMTAKKEKPRDYGLNPKNRKK